MLLPSALGSSPYPPVSVYGTGTSGTIAAFLDAWLRCFPTLFRSASRFPIRAPAFPCALVLRLHRYFHSRLIHYLTCPRSSVLSQYRNLHLLSIGYGSRPHLRPRLPQSRSALLWKPWIFGHKDSHLNLATHSGILSSVQSTAPYRYRFVPYAMLLYQLIFSSAASAARFSPGHFRRRTSRPVSYYALFECMAASEPTSWLSSKSHILFHLTRTLGP